MAVNASAVSFKDATAVKAVDSHTYEIELQGDWAIGTVPHGGYVTSCFLRVAHTHFSTTLFKQNQPDAMTLHLEFPRRTEVGTATFIVKDVKLGRQLSMIHISLVQHGREAVIGYFNHTNLAAETGVSFPTQWQLNPEPYPVDLAKLARGEDSLWAEQKAMPFSNFRKASNRVRFFFPSQGQKVRSLSDQWLRFRNGEKFTNESLGYVADMFPQIVESFKAEEDPYAIKQNVVSDPKTGEKSWAKFWYPTVVLNLDVKKSLPKEGVDWLFVRTQSKLIQRGRLDLEVIVMDAEGDVVALSHHSVLVLGAERNTAARTRAKSDTKL
ncbi:hypothetical protein EJ08DRAFT_686384 [Tothia fuscella]|uniref:Thioesterase-like superfamily-domain-containing protein n=1 Tax=Tothia fuscella TaxID=1048955 RepID=A0A9P4U1U5_9PEZI|nr:hypothetical protein EJ08DRAFT_686384 [Tothia fuscella]